MVVVTVNDVDGIVVLGSVVNAIVVRGIVVCVGTIVVIEPELVVNEESVVGEIVVVSNSVGCEVVGLAVVKKVDNSSQPMKAKKRKRKIIITELLLSIDINPPLL